MRSAIVVLAASGCAQAAWLRWSANQEEMWAAQETGHATESDQIGWTPIPTPAPGVRSDGEVVLDLLKRQTSKTDWTNSETCGWFSGISSSAVLCGDGFTCATNSKHVVACVSGTFSPFYQACLDYSAFQEGSCSNLDAATGCCQQAAQPACGTYIWTGAPERFMYKCFESASIVSILDVPQFVVDASLFSKTHTTPTPTAISSKTATSGSASSSGGTGGSNGGGSDADPAADPGSGSTTGNSQSSNNASSNTPAIVGGVIGGIAGLLFLLLLLLFCLRRKTKGKLGLGFTRNKKNKKEDNSSKAYHNTKLTAAGAKGRSSSGSDPITVVPVPIQQQQQQQPQHHYHNQEQHHYHPQAQAQPQLQLQQQQPQQLNLQQHQDQQAPPPQYQGPAGGQQPVSMSYTVNEGTTHASQPSFSQSTSYTAASSTSMPSSSGEQSRFLVGGILPIVHNSNVKQQYQQPQPQSQSQSQAQAQPYYPQQPTQPQFQQYSQQPLQQQQQQPGMQPQLQPVNHIHVYYAPPTQQHTEQGASTAPSQFSSPSPETQRRSGIVPDALGLFTDHQTQRQAESTSQERSQNQQTERTRERGPEREQDQDHIPAYYSHSRDVSSSTSRRGRSPSPDADGEWMAARGPGYRQSF